MDSFSVKRTNTNRHSNRIFGRNSSEAICEEGDGTAFDAVGGEERRKRDGEREIERKREKKKEKEREREPDAA